MANTVNPKPQNLFDTLLLAGGVAFLGIWVYEIGVRKSPFKESYWLIMLCLACFLGFILVKGQQAQREAKQPKAAETIKSKKVPLVKASIQKKKK